MGLEAVTLGGINKQIQNSVVCVSSFICSHSWCVWCELVNNFMINATCLLKGKVQPLWQLFAHLPKSWYQSQCYCWQQSHEAIKEQSVSMS